MHGPSGRSEGGTPLGSCETRHGRGKAGFPAVRNVWTGLGAYLVVAGVASCDAPRLSPGADGGSVDGDGALTDGAIIDGAPQPRLELELLAGDLGGPGNVDGVGPAAAFSGPTGVAVDRLGNVYVADQVNDFIRKVSPAGAVTAFAGAAGVFGAADGSAAEARFSFPAGVAVDAAGNVYVVDTNNSTIREITSDGVVTTLAGAAGVTGSADGAGSAARFRFPTGAAVDREGNVYVADRTNSILRKVTAAGVVTTLAGTPGAAGAADGTGAAARFNLPFGVTVDQDGNVYVADQGNHTLRKVTPAGVTTTLAGTAGVTGSADGVGEAARFDAPAGVTVDQDGNVYVADQNNHVIRTITPAGATATLAGTAGLAGAADGTGAAARFNSPAGVAVDGDGNLYVADMNNSVLRKITRAGVVTTLAGAPGLTGGTDGAGAQARFDRPSGVAVDRAGITYVADTENFTIRKITAAGDTVTLAGTAELPGAADGVGPAARFSDPGGVAVDGAGNVYVADTENDTIRKITPDGLVTTIAGVAGRAGRTDGLGSAARFDAPAGIAADRAGNLYVTDQNNHSIRKIAPDGGVTTLAGTAGMMGSADGTGAAARFYFPGSVAIDGADNLYVADENNYTIRKVTAAGVVTTLAGTAGLTGRADGAGPAARFTAPAGLAVDGAGNVYVAESHESTIRKITPSGVTTTLAGTAGVTGILLGRAPRLGHPRGLAITGDRLVICDANAILLLRQEPP